MEWRERERERERKEKKARSRTGTQEGTRGRGFRAVLPEHGAREAAFTSIRNLLPYPILKYRG